MSRAALLRDALLAHEGSRLTVLPRDETSIVLGRDGHVTAIPSERAARADQVLAGGIGQQGGLESVFHAAAPDQIPREAPHRPDLDGRQLYLEAIVALHLPTLDRADRDLRLAQTLVSEAARTLFNSGATESAGGPGAFHLPSIETAIADARQRMRAARERTPKRIGDQP